MSDIDNDNDNDIDKSIAYVPAVCSVCGEYRPEEFEERMRDIVASSPELAEAADVEWVFVCGACTARGLCPCCQEGIGHHQAGAA